MESAATDKPRVPCTTTRRSLLRGSEQMEVKHRFIVTQRIDRDLAIIFKLHAEHWRLLAGFTKTHRTAAPSALGFLVHGMDVALVVRKEPDLFLGQARLREECPKVIVIERNETIPMMRDLRRAVRREIETEAHENLRALLELIVIRDLVDAEFLATHRAFLSSIAERIQLGAGGTMRANDVPRRVAFGRTHLEFEVRQERIGIDNHCGSAEWTL